MKKYLTLAGKPQWSDEAGCSVIRVYLILTAQGELKKTKKSKYGVCIYTQEKRAITGAKDDGDSVVMVEVPLKKEPIFIRKKVV
jgi:hypothetical protein